MARELCVGKAPITLKLTGEAAQELEFQGERREGRTENFDTTKHVGYISVDPIPVYADMGWRVVAT